MFHPELRLLRCLHAIAKEESVTRAAERLHLTQPTVSGQLKELEKQLGFPLFIRTTRSISPTPELTQLLPLVEEIVAGAQRLQSAVDDIQQERTQQFRVGGAMYSLDFDERIDVTAAFLEQNPKVNFVVDNRLQHSQIEDLISGRLDISFLLGIPVAKLDPPQGAGLITNEIQYPDTLDRVVLARRRVGLLVPANSPLGGGTGPIAPSHLNGEKIAMLSREHGDSFIGPITEHLEDCGAELVTPPEGNALAVERYAARLGISALETGWFPPLEGQVFRHVDGLDRYVDFSLVLGSAPAGAALRFFDFAEKWAAAQVGDA